LVGIYYAVLPDMDAKHILLEAPGSQGTAVQSQDLSSALVATQHILFIILVCTKFKNFAFVKDTQCKSGLTAFPSTICSARQHLSTICLTMLSVTKDHTMLNNHMTVHNELETMCQWSQPSLKDYPGI
jgi:hypothetical protein